ncbi:MAG: hypothetical protein KDD82_25345 [Planctomycetes bacterium]|nr:hypothetical protein [Planctomycetota bacterium]
MGNTIWFRVEDPGSPLNDEDDRSALEREAERLDRLAAQLGVTAPSAFFDCSELATEFAEALNPLDPDWFEAGEGIATAAALIGALDPTRDAELLEDLRAWRAFLGAAAAAGQRFNLLVVP